MLIANACDNYRRRNVSPMYYVWQPLAILIIIVVPDFASVPTRTYAFPFVDRRQIGGDWQRIVHAASLISRKSYFPIRSASGRISTVEKPVAFANARASRDSPSFSCFSLAIDSYRFDMSRNKPQGYFRLIRCNSSRLSLCLAKHIWQHAVCVS